MNRIKNEIVNLYYQTLTAINHAFGGVGLWLILDELGIIQAIKFHFLGLGGEK